MDLLKKQRLQFTFFMTAFAAAFLFVIMGGMFGLFCASSLIAEERALETSLQSKSIGTSIGPDPMCLTFCVGTPQDMASPDFSFYGEDATFIIQKSILTSSGRFCYNNRYFVVESVEYNGGTFYAVYDRTSQHEAIMDRLLQTALLYAMAILLANLLSYLISAKTMQPVEEAITKQRDLIANASHELKTPLTIINTNLELVKSEPNLSHEQAECISAIDAQLVRMQGLIQNMLELSKLENTEIEKSPVDFSKVVEGACLSFEVVCFEKNVPLLVDVQPNVVIEGEQASLERLVVILLDNAVKYCGENGKVGCRLMADNKKVTLSVKNTGEAISKEDAKHVFDRFYRTDGAREKKDNQSYGLGLSIASATVKAHGGTISCHGIEGKGTVFDVTIPLSKNKKK